MNRFFVYSLLEHQSRRARRTCTSRGRLAYLGYQSGAGRVHDAGAVSAV